MSDNRVATYKSYISTWSNITDSERADRLAKTVVKDLVFRNPHKVRFGMSDLIEHEKGFQRNNPGASFRMNWVIGWGAFDVLAEWQLVNPDGTLSFNGYDALTFDENGLIKAIVLWDNTEEFKLA